MNSMYLHYFTDDKSIPFYIHYGVHNTDFYMHTHADFSELVIVLNGTALHRVDDEAYFIKKGDVFVISNNTAHGYENTNDFHICNIMYQPDIHFLTDSDIRKLPGFHALFVIEPYLTNKHSFQSRLKLQLAEFEQVSNMIHAMLSEFDRKSDGWRTILNAQFMLLVVLLSRYYSLPSPNEKSDVINIANSVSYIENHYKEPITIEELAALSNFSTRHFTRVFTNTYKATPGKYILNLRMQQASMLLETTNLSISEIAYQSGFSDSNYFSRQFHKHYGITPKQYRNQNKAF